jgi:hypothetical protein
MLPFTREQFLAVFVVHNHALWPLHLAAALLGIATMWALLGPRSGLALLVLWRHRDAAP